MPETDAIPVSASVASTGKGIRYIGNWVYAYSGTVSVSSSSNQHLLDFTTGAGLIVGSVELHGAFAQIGQNQMNFKVFFNEETVLATFWEATLDASFLDYPTTLIIPPFTHCQMDMAQSSGADKNMQLTFTGRVYGAE